VSGSAEKATQERITNEDLDSTLDHDEISWRLPDTVAEEDVADAGDLEGPVVMQQPSDQIRQKEHPLSAPEILLIPGDASDEDAIDPREAGLSTDRLQKGPVAVQANLDPDTEKAAVISSPDQPVKEKIIEAEPLDHLSLEEKADSLPEIVHITLEDAVKDEVLQGWEDDWVAYASYDAKRWGRLEEPKIDFVYLCEYKRWGNTRRRQWR
jgi:hypothetical protein